MAWHWPMRATLKSGCNAGAFTIIPAKSRFNPQVLLAVMRAATRRIQTGLRPCCRRGEDGGRYFASKPTEPETRTAPDMPFDLKRTAPSVKSS